MTQPTDDDGLKIHWTWFVMLFIVLVPLGLLIWYAFAPLDVPPVPDVPAVPNVPEPQPSPESSPIDTGGEPQPRGMKIEQITYWWEGLPDVLPVSTVDTASTENIRPADYTGPESCRKCHQKNYDHWSEHPHRWMNALADDSTVKGDFSGTKTIDYLGGTASFVREGPAYRMRLEREGESLFYDIRQTLGSRFFQYYIGTLIDSTRPQADIFGRQDHVLPFGYWLDEEQWVPVVHVHGEFADRDRHDPFDLPTHPKEGEDILVYAQSCNHCHTTFSLGDMLIRNPNSTGRYPPAALHLSLHPYLADAHPDLLPQGLIPEQTSLDDAYALMTHVIAYEAPEHAVTLGISCEACHLGCREHAEGKRPKPEFVPFSAHLARGNTSTEIAWSRNQAVNWACSRCHTGNRPYYADGTSTWNSTEYSDAMKGACYSELTCIHCHNPHKGIGREWTRTPAEDDASCLACHDQFAEATALSAHTHHAAGSEGSHCMNCHMPRTNEGLQDVVRTHAITSPTRPEMIHANHPNACNLCHTDQPIDWTIEHLTTWYGADFSDKQIAASYPDRRQPVAVGWTRSENEAVRLVGADAIVRQRDRTALPHAIEILDDPFLINRQLTARGLERWLDVDLFEEFGYRFYMTPQYRAAPLERLRQYEPD